MGVKPFRILASSVCIALLTAATACAQPKKPAFKEIDAGTIAVYEKLGAEYGGWISKNDRPDLSSASFVSRSDIAEHDYPAPILPGFRFRTFPKASLPRVAVPFGLDLSSSNATNADIEEMDAPDNLVVLNLSSKITGAGLKGLAGFDKLAVLRLGAAQVTGDGIKHLAGVKGLVSLEIYNPSPLNESAFKALGELKNLRVLRLNGDRVQPEWIKSLAGLKKLNTLDLGRGSERAKVLDALSEIGLLHALPNAAGKNGDRPNSADEVVSFRESLDLRPTDLARLRTFKNLSSLRLGQRQEGRFSRGDGKDSGYKSVAAMLKDVAQLENLAELDFGGYPSFTRVRKGPSAGGLSASLPLHGITGVGLSELAGLKHLTSLNLSSAGLTRAGIKELGGLKNLTKLDLSSTPITDAGLKELAGLKKLASLKLSDAEVTNAGMKAVAGFNDLASLSLANTRVRDFGVKELAGLANLTAPRLEFYRSHRCRLARFGRHEEARRAQSGRHATTDAGIAELQKALPNCKIER